MITPKELAKLDGPELVRRRSLLLHEACPNCDRDQVTLPCTCHEILKDVELIEAELKARGELP